MAAFAHTSAFFGCRLPATAPAVSRMHAARRAVSRRRTPPRATAPLPLPDPDVLDAEWTSTGIAPIEVIEHALRTFGDDVAIAFSGAEDVVLIEYANRTKLPYRVFALDTGRLHPETYRFYNDVERHYKIRIEYTFPNSDDVTALVNKKGLFSFYEDGHEECCGVRKVRPLRKKLATLRAWITGQRRDQSPSTRTTIPLLQVDPSFTAVDDMPLYKYNPLANTSSEEVWATIRMTEVPYNPLHAQGFVSIGCQPCTRAVLPNQHEREGRWWWEEATQKECGLHRGNVRGLRERENLPGQLANAEQGSFVQH